MLLRLELQEELEHAVGGELDPNVDPVRLINMAGRKLNTVHPWRWKRRPSYSLTVGASQDWIDLPSDFDHLISVESGDVDRNVRMTTLDVIDRYRSDSSDSTINTGDWWVALEWPKQKDASSPQPQPRLAVYPTPDAEDTLLVNANTGWTELTDDLHVAGVPVWMDDALIEFVRAYGRARVNGTMPDTELQPLLTSESWRSLLRHDGWQQSDLGEITGGHLDTRPARVAQWLPSGEITIG